jgi:transcription initiation factor TFIIIB Brf1 subunit/transcription initiation factor TFIIB
MSLKILKQGLDCNHKSIEEVEGVDYCTVCGFELLKISQDSEWRFYCGNDSRNIRDPSRCHYIKQHSKNIDKILEKLHLKETMKKQIEIRYKRVVGDQTIRGKNRKSVVGVCWFRVRVDNGDFCTIDEIREALNLDKKSMSAALTKYYLAYPEDRNKEIKPINLIKKIMIKAEIDLNHYDKIVSLTQSLESKNNFLEKSTPQSVASAIVYLYMNSGSAKICKKEFSEKVNLSDITITKLANEASKLLNINIL